MFSVVPLPKLVQTKLVAWRDKDRARLRDLIEVGLKDSTWPPRFVFLYVINGFKQSNPSAAIALIERLRSQG